MEAKITAVEPPSASPHQHEDSEDKDAPSLLDRFRHLDYRIRGIIGMLALAQGLGFPGSRAAEASENAAARFFADDSSIAVQVIDKIPSASMEDILPDSLHAAKTPFLEHVAASGDLELAGQSFTRRISFDSEHDGLRLGLRGSLASYENKDSSQHGFVMLGKGPVTAYLRGGNEHDTNVGFDIAMNNVGHASSIYFIPAWLHIDESGDVFGYTLLGKTSVQADPSTKIVASADYEIRNSSAEDSADSHAEYIAAIGKTLGVSIGRDYRGTLRGYVGYGAEKGAGGLAEARLSEDGKDKALRITVAEHPVRAALGPEAVEGKHDRNTIGQFPETETHLRVLPARQNSEGFAGSALFQSTNGHVSISPEIAYTARGGFGGTAGIVLAKGQTPTITSGGFIQLHDKVFLEGRMTGSDGQAYISFNF